MEKISTQKELYKDNLFMERSTKQWWNRIESNVSPSFSIITQASWIWKGLLKVIRWGLLHTNCW